MVWVMTTVYAYSALSEHGKFSFYASVKSYKKGDCYAIRWNDFFFIIRGTVIIICQNRNVKILIVKFEIGLQITQQQCALVV